MKYSSRKRVETALNHQEPDKVPCDLTIEPTAYEGLCNYLNLAFEPKWWDDWNHAYPSVEVLQRLKVDVMHVQMNDVPKEFDINIDEFKDQWGITKKKIVSSDGSFMYNLVDYPLKDAQTVDDVLSYNWPDAEEIVDVSGLREEVKQLYNNTEYALTATFGGNVFERPHYLRGMDTFFLDLVLNPDIAQALIEKVLEIQMKVDKMVLKEIGEYLTYMRFRGEDLGTQNGLLISPQTISDIVRPRLEKEWRNAKKEFVKYNPNGKIMVHSCGAIYDIIDMFIDMGADMLNPLQPNAHGMDTKKINAEFGDRLCFHGAIDTQGVLNEGSVEDVINEVKQRISDLAPGGGYIVAPAHNIQHGVSAEKIVAMYDAIQEFGVY